MSDSEPDQVPVKKKKVTDKQMENLRAGMAKLKAKREAVAKQREEHEEKKKKGEIPADAPRPQLIPEPKKPKAMPLPPAEQPLVVKEKKPRVAKPRMEVDEVKSEMALLRAELSAMKKPAEIKTVETIVEKPVDRIVEKKLTGSDLLNEIFFRK